MKSKGNEKNKIRYLQAEKMPLSLKPWHDRFTS